MSVPDVGRLDAETFGRVVLGPILAEFCLRLWLFERFLQGDEAVLLFCARGGLRLRLAYERFLDRTALPQRVPHADLMVSRLVAARTAFDPPSPGVLSELEREFSGQSMAEIAAPWRSATISTCRRLARAVRDGNVHRAPGGRRARRGGAPPRGRGAGWAVSRPSRGLYRRPPPRRPGRYRPLRQHGPDPPGGHPGPAMVRPPIRPLQLQGASHAAFRADIRPQRRERRVQPWEVRTSALRFWQLIEACLEPDLASVRTFTAGADGAAPRANLQVPGWESRVAPEQPACSPVSWPPSTASRGIAQSRPAGCGARLAAAQGCGGLADAQARWRP